MKSLRESILDAEDELVGRAKENAKSVIIDWILDNYLYVDKSEIKVSNKPNRNGLYKVDIKLGRSKYINVADETNITSLTNGLFEFNKINGGFNCSYCNNLISLEGAPKKVLGEFGCADCNKLTSLKGAPKETNDFLCCKCSNLLSIEEAPEVVHGIFSCANCKKIKSLKGAPKEVRGNFYCSGCDNLQDLSELDKIKIGGKIYK